MKDRKHCALGLTGSGWGNQDLVLFREERGDRTELDLGEISKPALLKQSSNPFVELVRYSDQI